MIPVIARRLGAYCEKHGLKLVTDPQIGYAGYIEAPGGRRSYFKGAHFDLNQVGAAEIANDKAYTAYFLKQAGLRVPDGIFISSPKAIEAVRHRNPIRAEKMVGLKDVMAFAESVGFPVFAKPNDGQQGIDVMRFTSPYQLEKGLEALFQRHDHLLIQEAVTGRDLRVMVLDGEALCAIERKAPEICGDGARTLGELIARLPERTRSDPRLLAEIGGQGLSLESVPEEGRHVRLLPAANLSAGGHGREVTGELDAAFKKIAAAAARTLGLRYCGIDMMVAEPADPASDYKILEVNAAPGLNEFYRQGAEQAALAEGIYEKLFDALRERLIRQS